MRYSIIYILIAIFLLSSCILEERIHFSEDLSGVYEMSFAIESNDEEDDSPGMSQNGMSEIDSLLTAIKNIDGINDASMNASDNGFNVAMNFDNIEALNKIHDESKDRKAVAKFENKDGRLFFSLSDFPTDDKSSTDADEWRKYFKHRVIITFDKKIKGLKAKGFKKLDKYTLVYDSDKIDEANVSFSLKHKK